MKYRKGTYRETADFHHMKDTITLHPAISDGGAQFISAYLTRLMGVAKRAGEDRGRKKEL